MANTIIEFLSLTGLGQYDAKIKEFITTKVAEGDAQSFKYVNLVNGVLKFYTINPIAEDTVPAFEIELPEQDLSHLMALVKDATAGNIAVFNNSGQVEDAGIKVADLATKAEVAENAEAIAALDERVGEIPEGYTEETIIGFINKKAEETLAAASGGSTESAASVLAALNTFKSEINPKVEANEAAAATAQAKGEEALAKAEEVAGDLAEEIAAREAADNSQAERISVLEGQIVGLSGAMHFEGVKDAIPEDVIGYENGDVIIVGDKEYVFNNGAFVEFGDVNAQAEAITELTGRMTTAESEIDQLQTDLDAAEESLALKAEQSALEEEIAAREAADALKANQADLEAANAEIAKKADQAAFEEAVETLEAADAQVLADAKADTDTKLAAEVEARNAAIAEAMAEATYDDTTVKADIVKNTEAASAAQAAADKAQEEVDALELAHAADKQALEAKDTEIEGNVTTLQEKVTALEEIQHVEISESQINAFFETA